MTVAVDLPKGALAPRLVTDIAVVSGVSGSCIGVGRKDGELWPLIRPAMGREVLAKKINGFADERWIGLSPSAGQHTRQIALDDASSDAHWITLTPP